SAGSGTAAGGGAGTAGGALGLGGGRLEGLVAGAGVGGGLVLAVADGRLGRRRLGGEVERQAVAVDALALVGGALPDLVGSETALRQLDLVVRQAGGDRGDRGLRVLERVDVGLAVRHQAVGDALRHGDAELQARVGEPAAVEPAGGVVAEPLLD